MEENPYWFVVQNSNLIESSLYMEQMHRTYQIIKERFKQTMEEKDYIALMNHVPKYPPTYDKFMRDKPWPWLRSVIGSGALSNSHYDQIAKFSNGQIWDIGAGSGYNAYMLGKFGVDVYPIDTPMNEFSYFFVNVHQEPYLHPERLKNIISKDGAILYSWPRGYFHLDLWLKMGGRKVIVIATFINGISPVFPPQEFKDKFKLTRKIDLGQPSYYDVNSRDTMYFWEVN